MPNWCYNKVTIIGHKEDLDQFEEQRFSFSYFVPPPADCPYEWYRDNWSVRSEHHEYEVKIRDENLYVAGFDTAWGPPIRFFRKLLEKYPRCWLKCAYTIEDGVAGIWLGHYKNGEFKEQWFDWIEPRPDLTTDGQI